MFASETRNLTYEQRLEALRSLMEREEWAVVVAGLQARRERLACKIAGQRYESLEELLREQEPYRALGALLRDPALFLLGPKGEEE